MISEEFAEVLYGDSDVNVVINLNGYANSVALTYAEASRENDIILNTVIRNCLFKKLNYILRPLEVTGGAYTNLNDNHILNLCKNFVSEELVNSVGGYGIEGIVDRNTYALLALTHTERAAKLNLFAKLVLRNKILKLFNNLTRSLYMT